MVYILTKEAEFDLEKEKTRIMEGTGALTDAQRERGRVELEAERSAPGKSGNRMIAAPKDRK